MRTSKYHSRLRKLSNSLDNWGVLGEASTSLLLQLLIFYSTFIIIVERFCDILIAASNFEEYSGAQSIANSNKYNQ